MRRVLPILAAVALVCFVADAADANPVPSRLWGLHYAGPHNAKTNTCTYVMEDCAEAPRGDAVTEAPAGPMRCDIYVVAMSMDVSMAGTRYGLCCDGPFYFYGWTKCSDFEIPTAGWPGCGEANAQTWTVEQTGMNITVGILDVYAYAGVSEICICSDQRVGFAEFCDGSQPSPNCWQFDHPYVFGCVGFGQLGYNPCDYTPVEETTWGLIKAVYK
jgi:hypothetical protein